MRRLQFVTLGLLGLCSFAGCITSSSTKGYQTNPPVRQMSNGGLGDLAKKLNPNKRQPTSARIPSNDPTSLQSPGTVTPELFIVAGEMSMNRQAYDAAERYFNRALKMEPRNIRANIGLAKIAETKGNDRKANRIYSNLKKWHPGKSQLIDSLGQMGPAKHTGFSVEPVTEQTLATYEQVQKRNMEVTPRRQQNIGNENGTTPVRPGQFHVQQLPQNRRVLAEGQESLASNHLAQLEPASNAGLAEVVTREVDLVGFNDQPNALPTAVRTASAILKQQPNEQSTVHFSAKKTQQFATRVQNPFFVAGGASQASYEQLESVETRTEPNLPAPTKAPSVASGTHALAAGYRKSIEASSPISEAVRSIGDNSSAEFSPRQTPQVFSTYDPGAIQKKSITDEVSSRRSIE